MLAADATFKVDEEDASFSPVAITAGVAGLALAIVAAKVVAGLFVTHRRDHPRREAILAFLAQNPGAGLREIGRATEIPTGTIAHHMGSLLRSGKVTETKHGNVRRFFLADDRLAELDAAVALRDADLRSLVEHLVRAGPSTQGALVPPGVALSSVQSRLDRLVRIGLVASTRSGRFRHYEATPLAAALLSGNRVGEAASKDHVHPTAAYA
jgi:predicted transcriptional regulator